MIIDTYQYTMSEPARQTLDVLDIIITCIFIIECVIKVIALGFVNDEGSYLTDSWNKLDFMIVIFSIIDIIFSGSDVGYLKIIRLLRVLRPLRFISRNPNMRIVVNSLINSITGIVNVALIIFIIW